MRAKTNRAPVFVLLLVGVVAGVLLRHWQLGQAFTQEGRIIPGSISAWALNIFCVLITVILAGICLKLQPRATYEESFSSGLPEFAVSVAAAALLMLGSAMTVLNDSAKAGVVTGILGVLAGLCIVVTAAKRYRGVIPPVFAHVLPCIYLVVKLILDFKQWSVDPAILDYCYQLFASIAAMCATYHLGGFCFGKGQRRMSAFWCLAGVLFCAVSVADGGVAHGLVIGGMGLWIAVNGWQLLED